jgi:hypothetical protein
MVQTTSWWGAARTELPHYALLFGCAGRHVAADVTLASLRIRVILFEVPRLHYPTGARCWLHRLLVQQAARFWKATDTLDHAG